ncbi:Ribosomal L1 domain containing protein [Trichuris trichiura]|uniref:Ribosomal L1 domain containing protein n=1 Tax=Trichuris trichiura TaxID=36087 RepID=A0A077Z0A9_TRITR|nr:Ribosomal L1 domain containing protein [Trichuris trichiura]
MKVLVFPDFQRLLSRASLQLLSVRFAKRRGVKALRLAREAKLGKKKAALDKPFFFLRLSIALRHPARFEPNPELLAEPFDDVWYEPSYLPRVYTVAEAVRLHRQLQHPTMLNNSSAFVRLRLDLNMQLERKVLYASLIAMPYPFAHGQKRTILAFAKDPNAQILASEAGAEITGGVELVKKILKGTIRIDDVDYSVCHLDMGTELNPLRGIMKKKFPSRKMGAIGTDIAALVKHFISGIAFELKQDELNPTWGVSESVIGKLDMSVEYLEANLKTYIERVFALRDPPKSTFIDRAVMTVIPGAEYYVINLKPFLPEIPKEEEEEEEGDETSAQT